MIIAPTSSVTNAAICEGESYLFNGTSYNTTGTYSAPLISVTTGCDSTAILNLSVIAVSLVIDDAICEGETYFFNDHPYTEETDTIIQLGGGVCNNVRLRLKLKKASEPEIYNESICLGSSYDFYGNTYFSGGTYTAHLINAVGCDSTAILNLTVLAPSSYERQEVCSNNLPYLWNNKEYNFEGIYKDTIPNANSLGCDSISTLELVIKQVTYSTTPVSVCEKDLPYFWNLKNYAESGIFKDTLVNSVGCDSIATLKLTVRPTTYSTTPISVCQKDLPYIWNTKSYTQSGIFKDTLVNSVGCDSVVTLNLTVNPIPTVTNTSLTETICSGTSTTLVTLTSDVASTTFEWTATTDAAITGFITNGTNTIPAQTLTNPSNSTVGTVTYVITPKANGCTGTVVNYVVTVNPEPITSDIYHQ